MGLVRTWTGQLARAAGASLIAPLVLLLASSVVAFGGGVGSFASLQEVASGPALPDIGLAVPSGSALANAGIVGADLSPPADVSQPPGPAPDALASAAPPAREQQSTQTATVTVPEASGTEPSGESFELRGPSGTPGGGATEPTTPPSAPSAPVAPAPAPAPVEGLLDATRGLGETLAEPLAPLTNTISNLWDPPRR